MLEETIDLQSIQRRERQTWALLYDSLVHGTFGLIWKLTGGDRLVCEDLNQETWLAAIAEQVYPGVVVIEVDKAFSSEDAIREMREPGRSRGRLRRGMLPEESIVPGRPNLVFQEEFTDRLRRQPGDRKDRMTLNGAKIRIAYERLPVEVHRNSTRILHSQRISVFGGLSGRRIRHVGDRTS